MPLDVLVQLLLGVKLPTTLLHPTDKGLEVDLLVMPDEVPLERGGEVTLVTSMELCRDRGTAFGVVFITDVLDILITCQAMLDLVMFPVFLHLLLSPTAGQMAQRSWPPLASEFLLFHWGTGEIGLSGITGS